MIELTHHHGHITTALMPEGVSTAICYPSGPSTSWYRDTYF
jgi:hypothetical protein